MGYCMDQRSSFFHIAKANEDAALQAIKALAGTETIEDGSGRHFSRVDTGRFLAATTLDDALLAWRWETYRDGDGVIGNIGFRGEKYGDDTVLFTAIAPFVEPGSYIEMNGEDGALWRWIFKNGTVDEVSATITWG
jgi:hypothetical protein